VPDKLDEYADKKLYLHATNTLCDSVHLLRTDLSEVHALKDIAYALDKWKEVHIYITNCIPSFIH